MQRSVQKYMADIGRKGGKASRRNLSPEQARDMVRIREARRAYTKYYAQCFWSYDPAMVIGADDVAWVAEQLMKHGNREAWQAGTKLCR